MHRIQPQLSQQITHEAQDGPQSRASSQLGLQNHFLVVCQGWSTAPEIGKILLQLDFQASVRTTQTSPENFSPHGNAALDHHEWLRGNKHQHLPVAPLADPAKFKAIRGFSQGLPLQTAAFRVLTWLRSSRIVTASGKFTPALCKVSNLLWRRKEADAFPD